jgi:hypothetical protein
MTKLAMSLNCCSTKTKLISGQIQPAGDQWPVFLYANYSYDTEDPWNGLLRSGLLVSVEYYHLSRILGAHLFQAYKHVFTSPSSVDQEPRATRSGNARIHGMRSVTKASIAYVATQVICNVFHKCYCINPLPSDSFCTDFRTSVLPH